MSHSFRRRVTCVALLTVIALPTFGQVSATPVPAVSISETAAQKGLLLSFISYNSVESKIVHDQLASDPAVKAFIEKHFVLTSYVEGRDIVPTARYQVTLYPTLIAAKPDGTEIDRLVGYTRSTETLAFLESASNGRSGLVDLAEKSSSADASLEDRLKLAEAYIKRGRCAEGVRELTVCLQRSSAMGEKEDRKYLKVTLARLAALGAREPAATEAIRARRDVLEKLLSPHFPEPMSVVFAFNEALKQPERNVDLYLRIPEGSPARERLFPAIFMSLVVAQKYQEANAVVDLESFVNGAYPKKNSKAAFASKAPLTHGHASHSSGRVIQLTVSAVEVTLGTGQLEKSKRLAGRAMETFAEKDLSQRLRFAATRAATPAAQEFIAWLATLTSVSNLRP